jgi:hypothetical protein
MASNMSELPHNLTSLTDREAIADALYRLLTSIDENNVPLFNSSWSGEDAIFDFGGNITSGLPAINAFLIGKIGPMDTTHMPSNVRIELKEGASDAKLTAYALAQHAAPGKGGEDEGPKFLTGSRYYLDLVKKDGLWKISKFAMKVIWKQGDAAVMQSTS